MNRTTNRTRFLAAAGMALLLAGPEAFAAPPPWAPAHGYRAKNAPLYTGYTGYRWDRDFGVAGGRCNRDEVGTVLGAVVGGAIGGAVYDGDSKLVAILVGATVGAIIGREIGRDMNDADRACMGHVLELGRMGQPVSWAGGQPGLVYTMIVHDGFRQGAYTCRNFTIEQDFRGKKTERRSAACRVADGQWQLVRR